MSDPLKEHIKKLISPPEELYAAVLPYFHALKVAKKENLLTEGKVCEANYFVANGCLRMFFVNDKGVEQTIQFAIENWWLSDYQSFQSRSPSGFWIQAVEKSDLMAITYRQQEDLLQQFPQMERYFRLIHQRAHAAAQSRIRFLYDFSREELYHHFIKSFPGFVQRIPQYLLASYLGFTPEYLSEIRNKKLS